MGCKPPSVPSCPVPPCCHTDFLLTLKAAPSSRSWLLSWGPSLHVASHPARGSGLEQSLWS